MGKLTPGEIQSIRMQAIDPRFYGAIPNRITDTERQAHERYWTKVLERQTVEAIKPLQDKINTLTDRIENHIHVTNDITNHTSTPKDKDSWIKDD